MEFFYKRRGALIATCIFLLTTLLFTLDLFLQKARPASFDEVVHLTTIAQFAQAFQSGDFLVRWANNYSNYGGPLGIIAHQTTAYFGGLLVLLTSNVHFSFNILYFLGLFLSVLTFYVFLRQDFSERASLVAAVLYQFSAYRIMNVYVRGALPEIWAAIFLPLVLLAIRVGCRKNRFRGILLALISIFLLAVTHPMMLIVYLPIIGGVLVYEVWKAKREKCLCFLSQVLAMGFGVGLAAYYLLPLLLEIKYFYHGLSTNHFVSGYTLSLRNYFWENWPYFYQHDIYARGHVLNFGLIETLGVFLLVVLFMQALWRKNKKEKLFLLTWLVILIIYLLLLLPYSEILFQKISLLGNIQFQWRMLSGLIFIPGIIYAYFLNKLPGKIQYWFALLLLVLMAYLRFPQLYGKNFTNFSQARYFFTRENVHTVSMNTIWSDKSENYPQKTKQYAVISGRGKVRPILLQNSERLYETEANTLLRLVDYTFYFPGWRVYVDGVEQNIEFQDMNYRGLITYQVPAGKHSVKVVFENTKIRLLANLLSVFSAVCGGLFFFLVRKRLRK